MQIGQTIWAIDPCETPNGKKYLTVGNAYKIKEVTFTDVCVFVDTKEDLFFFKDKFYNFFSLTPPEGKGGVKESIIAQIEKSISELTQLRDHLTEVLNKE